MSVPPISDSGRFRASGAALLILGAVLLGFAGQFTLVSQVSYARDQQLAFDAFRFDLANSTAPVGQLAVDDRLIPVGSPVALIEIPSVGFRTVVLEGTGSAVTVSGPGHRRDTPLPGQAGASVVYGRQASFGGPFAAIGQLKPDTTIIVTTGQGVSRYRVLDVRYTGDNLPEPFAPGGGRLTLVSASGIPFLPSTVVRVDADLITPPKTTPTSVVGFETLDESELTMAGDPGALPLLVLSILLLGMLVPLFTIGRRFWGRWQTWIVALPVYVALGCFGARELAILLPNLI